RARGRLPGLGAGGRPARRREPSRVARSKSFDGAALVAVAGNGLSAAGDLYALAGDTMWASVQGIAKRSFPWREAVSQAWFIASVCVMPSILVAIPFG